MYHLAAYAAEGDGKMGVTRAVLGFQSRVPKSLGRWAVLLFNEADNC